MMDSLFLGYKKFLKIFFGEYSIFFTIYFNELYDLFCLIQFHIEIGELKVDAIFFCGNIIVYTQG